VAEESIKVTNLVYRYGSFTAVNGISFSIAAGEILGFLGPNGAGKTTTVKILTGQLVPHEGQVRLMGKDIVNNITEIRAKTGVCFEQTNLYEQMNALDNLKLFAELYGVKNFEGYQLLERVGLKGREKDRVSSFSKGMKQRLMIARSIVNSPGIIFMDEPTSGLDPVSSEAIDRIILEERRRGATIFLTTHDMWEAEKLCDRVAFMNKGRISALDSPDKLKQQFGRRRLVAQLVRTDGGLEKREIEMDTPCTATMIESLFRQEKVATLHSEEASLEDIFIKLTGERLNQ
jgi:ABC-2 type transport system ATP-binding protein